MRATTFLVFVAVLALAGCSPTPEMRPDPVELKGTLKLPGGASPKDLTVTFQPQQNTLGSNAKVGTDGNFTVKLVPGKYIYIISEESNSRVDAFKSVSKKYHTVNTEHSLSVENGQPITIELK